MNAPVGRVVIVGAGHAGGSALSMLKQYGYQGEIVMIGDEPIGPYHRPPLSKAYLKGNVGLDALMLRPNAYYEHELITLHLDATVATIDRAARTVTLGSGKAIAYEYLILATGSRARKLQVPGADLNGVLELRSIAHADEFRLALKSATRLAIIGGGYIGLEAAASAREAGIEVVIVERESRVLARVASAPISNFFEAYHRNKGAEILCNSQVSAMQGNEHGQIASVRLADGRVLAADAALVGVGAVACDELARAAGLECEGGIVVDAESRTSDPAIFAIGDVAWRPLPHYGRMFRVESVGNAVEQARQAASAIVGRPAPAPEVPWFWSDQYDLKLQIAGLPFDADSLVVRGDMDAHKFAVFHLHGDRVVAVESVNSAGDFVGGKRLIGEGKPVDPARLLDPAIPAAKAAL